MNLEPLFQEIKNLKKRTEKVIIYGFGSYGRNLYQVLKRNEIKVDGFAITGNLNADMVYEIPVYKASMLFSGRTGYILALNEKNAGEVEAYLKENQIGAEYIVNAGKYIEQFGEKRGTHVGSIEVTTVIGCKVNCRHCPQGLLTEKYFQNSKDRTRIMTIETFKKCLDFFPKEYDISFGGMSEPFLNTDFIDMLQIACKENRHISLYTTLVGVEKDVLEEVLKLPFQFVVLHVADKYGYAHIPLTKEYYANVERMINAKRQDGKSFVNMCNSQAEPDDKIKEICNGKYEIFTEMTDRAGNLAGEELIHNRINKGRISCGNLGKQMNNNILLPDGSVLLCCMDYGLRHILGNIYENTFEEIMNGEEMLRVKQGMAGDEKIDILCRTCSYARSL